MSDTESKTITPARPAAFIFDVDGVLLDIRRSFPEVIRRAIVEIWQKLGGESDCRGYGAEHEWVLKRHGAFNDDYDIAWLLLAMAAATGKKKLSEALPDEEKLKAETSDFTAPLPEWVWSKYGRAVPRDRTRARCAALYGSRGCGLHLLETPMLSCNYKELGVPCAIYSGRDTHEWELAKESLGWEGFPEELVIKSDSGVTKPSPEGLEILSKRLGTDEIVFFGDTASDMQAWKNFGKGRFAAIGGLLPEANERFDTTEEAVAFYLKEREICRNGPNRK